MAKGPFTETSRVDLDSLKDSTSKSWPATERKTGRLKTGPFPWPQGKFVLIPAPTYRVLWTTAEEPLVWLAIFDGQG